MAMKTPSFVDYFLCMHTMHDDTQTLRYASVVRTRPQGRLVCRGLKTPASEHHIWKTVIEVLPNRYIRRIARMMEGWVYRHLLRLVTCLRHEGRNVAHGHAEDRPNSSLLLASPRKYERGSERLLADRVRNLSTSDLYVYRSMHSGHDPGLLDAAPPSTPTSDIIEGALRRGVDNGILTLIASECILQKPPVPTTYYYALDRALYQNAVDCLNARNWPQ
jgi:hypothetical protein